MDKDVKRTIFIPKGTTIQVEIEGEGMKTISLPERCAILIWGEKQGRLSFPGGCAVEIDGEIWRISGAPFSRLFFANEADRREREAEFQKRFEAEKLARLLNPPPQIPEPEDEGHGRFGFGGP